MDGSMSKTPLSDEYRKQLLEEIQEGKEIPWITRRAVTRPEGFEMVPVAVPRGWRGYGNRKR